MKDEAERVPSRGQVLAKGRGSSMEFPVHLASQTDTGQLVVLLFPGKTDDLPLSAIHYQQSGPSTWTDLFCLASGYRGNHPAAHRRWIAGPGCWNRWPRWERCTEPQPSWLEGLKQGCGGTAPAWRTARARGQERRGC